VNTALERSASLVFIRN